jgi:apolipoprotein N-acyltransferase
MTSALEAEALAGASRRPAGRQVTLLLLNLLSVLMLSVSFAPFDCWFLAYAALAPWVLAVGADRSGRWAILTAWGAGLVYWLANLYWLTWITLLGYFMTAIFLSGYWLLAAVILRASIRRRWPTWLVLPVVWVALEYARGYIISGFPWFYLAHSQYRRTPLIQIADLTGQYGVSFLVAMANGAIADLLGAILAAPRSHVCGGPCSSVEPPAGQHGPAKTQDRGTPDSVLPEARDRQRPWQALRGLVATAAVAAAMLGYGWWRIGEPATSPGPVIGVVQQAYPIALNRRSPSWDDVLESHLSAASALTGTGCDLLLIPESMLPPGLNVDFLTMNVPALAPEYVSALVKRIYTPQMRKEYPDSYLLDHFLSTLREEAMKVGQLSRRLACPILAGGITVRPNPEPLGQYDYWLKFNSALWFDASEGSKAMAADPPPGSTSRPTSGPLTSVTRAAASTVPHGSIARDIWKSDPRYYSKMHLVPFSEYVPFKSSWLALHRFLRSFVPEVMEQLEPGEGPLTYTLVRPSVPAQGRGPVTSGNRAQSITAPGESRTWRLATPICYEGVFDYVCRGLVWRDGRKAVDILVNLSNDGWFVWQFDSGDFHRSTEQSQHLSQYCFRAVENRVPVVRAVNTGISASIDSTGAILAEVHRGPLTTMIAGTLLLDGQGGDDGPVAHGPLVLVDRRWSVYSRIGDVFAMLVSAAAVAMTVALIRRRGSSKERAIDAQK